MTAASSQDIQSLKNIRSPKYSIAQQATISVSYSSLGVFTAAEHIQSG